MNRLILPYQTLNRTEIVRLMQNKSKKFQPFSQKISKSEKNQGGLW